MGTAAFGEKQDMQAPYHKSPRSVTQHRCIYTDFIHTFIPKCARLLYIDISKDISLKEIAYILYYNVFVTYNYYVTRS